MQENVFYKIADKLKTKKTTRQERSEDKSERMNLNKMYQDLINKGYKKEDKTFLVNYLAASMTTTGRQGAAFIDPKMNALYQVLMNSELLDDEQLRFIGKVAISNKVKYDQLKEITNPDLTLQEMKYFYYAYLNGIDTKTFFTKTGKLKTERTILNIIRRSQEGTSSKKQSKKDTDKTNKTISSENRKIMQDLTRLGYDMNSLEKSIEELPPRALAEIIYMQAIELDQKDYEDLEAFLKTPGAGIPGVSNTRKDKEKEKYGGSTTTPSLDNLLTMSRKEAKEKASKERK